MADPHLTHSHQTAVPQSISACCETALTFSSRPRPGRALNEKTRRQRLMANVTSQQSPGVWTPPRRSDHRVKRTPALGEEPKLEPTLRASKSSSKSFAG